MCWHIFLLAMWWHSTHNLEHIALSDPVVQLFDCRECQAAQKKRKQQTTHKDEMFHHQWPPL
jgi:hypothetical protein